MRPRVPGATVFFTVCLAERGSDLLLREIVRLRSGFRETMAERPFAIEAMVVMPDHLHCVWRLPEGDADYSLRWRLIKSRFSRGLPKGKLRQSHVNRQERGIWQRRYWEHHMRGAVDLQAAIHYCWMSPVRQGFVKRPEDWRYSSIHRDRAVGTAEQA